MEDSDRAVLEARELEAHELEARELGRELVACELTMPGQPSDDL